MNPVLGHVAEQQIAAVSDPYRAFGPGEARGERLQPGVRCDQAVQRRIVTDHAGGGGGRAGRGATGADEASREASSENETTREGQGETPGQGEGLVWFQGETARRVDFMIIGLVSI